MDDLKREWTKRTPKYALSKIGLFEELSYTGGGEGDRRLARGKPFANNYELYIYAFFVGIYAQEQLPIPEEEETKTFGMPIDSWGRKTNRFGRTDFTELQDYMFMAVFTETDFDIHDLERGKVTAASVAKAMIKTMESYTNAGLQLIREQLDDRAANYFVRSTAFLDFLEKHTKVPDTTVLVEEE